MTLVNMFLTKTNKKTFTAVLVAPHKQLPLAHISHRFFLIDVDFEGLLLQSL